MYLLYLVRAVLLQGEEKAGQCRPNHLLRIKGNSSESRRDYHDQRIMRLCKSFMKLRVL